MFFALVEEVRGRCGRKRRRAESGLEASGPTAAMEARFPEYAASAEFQSLLRSGRLQVAEEFAETHPNLDCRRSYLDDDHFVSSIYQLMLNAHNASTHTMEKLIKVVARAGGLERAAINALDPQNETAITICKDTPAILQLLRQAWDLVDWRMMAGPPAARITPAHAVASLIPYGRPATDCHEQVNLMLVTRLPLDALDRLLELNAVFVRPQVVAAILKRAPNSDLQRLDNLAALRQRSRGDWAAWQQYLANNRPKAAEVDYLLAAARLWQRDYDEQLAAVAHRALPIIPVLAELVIAYAVRHHTPDLRFSTKRESATP